MKPLIFLVNYLLWLIIPFPFVTILCTFFNTNYTPFVQNNGFITVYIIVELLVLIALSCDAKNFQFIEDTYQYLEFTAVQIGTIYAELELGIISYPFEQLLI